MQALAGAQLDCFCCGQWICHVTPRIISIRHEELIDGADIDFHKYLMADSALVIDCELLHWMRCRQAIVFRDGCGNWL